MSSILRLVPLNPIGIGYNLKKSQRDKLLLVCPTTQSNTICLSNNKSSFGQNDTHNGLLQKQTQPGDIKSIYEFNKLLIAFVNSNQLQLASKLFSTLSCSHLNPNCWTYSIMIRCYCKNNLPNEAKRLLHHILDYGYRPNVATFTVLVNQFCVEGKTGKALEVIEMMGLVNCKPTVQTYNCLLKGLCYVGKVEEAYEFLNKFQDKYSVEPDIYTYTAIMDGFCKVGRSDEAFELLEEAQTLGLVPNVATYNTLFTGYFKEGKPLEGLKLLKKMSERDCMPDRMTYSTLLHGLLKWGEIREALGVYEEMVRVGFKVDGRIMNTLLRGLCRRSRKENELLNDVYKVFDKMKTWGILVYDFTFDLLIEAFCRGRKTDEALVSLESMVGFGNVPKENTFCNVIKALCDEGRVEAALKVLFTYREMGSLSTVSLGIIIDELNLEGTPIRSSAVYGLLLKLGVNPNYIP